MRHCGLGALVELVDLLVQEICLFGQLVYLKGRNLGLTSGVLRNVLDVGCFDSWLFPVAG